MDRPRAVVWSLAGLLAGAGGWLAGALIGSNLGRTVLAATATAAVLGLLARRPRFAVVASLATAVAASLVFIAGGAVTTLVAWPIAGLVIGLSSLALFHRTRARVVTLVAAPVLGTLGFVLGMVATLYAGMARNDALMVGHFLWGGAAGFGLFTVMAVRVLGARLDRVPTPAGGAA